MSKIIYEYYNLTILNQSRPDEATLAEELHKNVSYFLSEAYHFSTYFGTKIDVNVLGVIYTTNTFLPLLRAGKTKKVICVTSVLSDAELAAKHEITADPIYSISKAAMNMAVAKYAAQYKRAGFVFLAISPGVVQTDSLESSELSIRFVFILKLNLFSLFAVEQVAEPEFAHQMFVEIQAIYKNFHAAQTPEESVKAMLNVVNNATVDISGTVISYKGDKEWV